MTDLVLIHGMFGSGEVWRQLRPRFEAAGYRVHAPDLPGHGRHHADGVAGLGLDEYAVALGELLDTLAPRPVLIGHSMGALLAQKLAAERSLGGLALLAPVPPRAMMRLDLRRLAICWRLLRQHGPRFGPYRLAWEQARCWLFAGWSDADARRVHAQMGEESARVLLQMEAWPLDWRCSNRLRWERIRCPVFVAEAGQEKMLAPGSVAKIAACYHAEHRIYAHAGHLLILEPVAEQLAADLLTWLAGLQPRVNPPAPKG